MILKHMSMLLSFVKPDTFVGKIKVGITPTDEDGIMRNFEEEFQDIDLTDDNNTAEAQVLKVATRHLNQLFEKFSASSKTAKPTIEYEVLTSMLIESQITSAREYLQFLHSYLTASLPSPPFELSISLDVPARQLDPSPNITDWIEMIVNANM